MRATSAPSNLQGQRQPVINCCVHKCKWVHWGSTGRKKKRLSGQYSSREQSAREGNDLEDSAQICCSVKHGGAECEGRLVEMEEVVVRSGWKKKKKRIEKTVVAINIKCFTSIFSSPICLQFVFLGEIKQFISSARSKLPHPTLLWLVALWWHVFLKN